MSDVKDEETEPEVKRQKLEDDEGIALVTYHFCRRI